MRLWFNRPFALAYRVLSLIRQDDDAKRHTLICTHKQPYFAGYAAADEWAVEPQGLSSADYVKWCLNFAREQRVEVLIPGYEAVALVQASARFAEHGTRILAPASAETLPRLHDKAWVYRQLVDQPFLARSIELREPTALDAALNTLWGEGHAACIKPTVSVYGKGFYRLLKPDFERRPARSLTPEEWRSKATDPDGQCAPQQVLEYLPGHEFSVDCACDYGRLVVGVVRKKALTSSTQLLDDNPALLSHAALLVQRFALNGLINVQFKEDAQGIPKLLEINPRAAGGIAMSCLSGVNLPALALQGFLRGYGEVSAPPRPRTGLRVTEVGWAITLPATLPLPQPVHVDA